MIRPGNLSYELALLCVRELTKEHRRLAEIIEMIHTASLIHDDVLDDSDMRRGMIWSPMYKFAWLILLLSSSFTNMTLSNWSLTVSSNLSKFLAKSQKDKY